VKIVGGSDEEEVGLPQSDDEIDEANHGAPRHMDTRLQTALTSDGLQRRLLALYRDARLIMEEQGVNILYLALGRLKWFEAEKGDTSRHAPLVLVPVQLQRRSGLDRFTLKWWEEDVQENLTLAAKLNSEFGIELPKFPLEEDLVPSRYAEAVAKAVAGQRGWEVQADAMTLGFFSFAKFLMYRDLDPRTWPDPTQLLNHPALGGLLRDGFPAVDRPFAEDVNLDIDLPRVRETLVAAAPTLDRDALCNGVWLAGLDGLHDLVVQGRAFAEVRTKLAAGVTDAAFETDLTSARAAIAAHDQSLFRFLNGEFRNSMALLRGVLRGKPPSAHVKRVALLDDLLAARRHLLALRERAEMGRQAFGVAWLGA